MSEFHTVFIVYVLVSVSLVSLFAAHTAVDEDDVSVVEWLLHTYALSAGCVHDAVMYEPSPLHTFVKTTLILTLFDDSLCAFDVTPYR